MLYILKYTSLEEAIGIRIMYLRDFRRPMMTLNLREAELFLSAAGSDCGIANINIGTSGAGDWRCIWR